MCPDINKYVKQDVGLLQQRINVVNFNKYFEDKTLKRPTPKIGFHNKSSTGYDKVKFISTIDGFRRRMVLIDSIPLDSNI